VTSTLQYQSIGPERRVLNYIKERWEIYLLPEFKHCWDSLQSCNPLRAWIRGPDNRYWICRCSILLILLWFVNNTVGFGRRITRTLRPVLSFVTCSKNSITMFLSRQKANIVTDFLCLIKCYKKLTWVALVFC
jgi:hypothetical protein